ncbi:hypothetical protein OG607_06115 [Streptomyces sp. NBC_01537]|uniref:hypothetical protein n=1 Tax=Streptomyces sp. NBC_01537 TaxID=2903896 RepID=UPI0038674D4B
MTPTQAVDLCQAAARAALTVPGVAALQPDLGQRLAGAASRARQAAGFPALPAGAGIRAEHATDAPGWRVEVRCVLHEDRRVVDTARQVREQVRAAARDHLTAQGTPEPVTVLVTVTHLKE